MFVFGLFKKVVIADNVARFASPAFSQAQAGVDLAFFEAWGGALAYTLHLYFDFSGYSDMALGLGRMFGIKLPINFNSPYKSKNIIEFWRRWHITLSRFLRDYLYIQLGGNRKGEFRRYVNIMITMLLGGLWHGAGWTFVVWGGLHGVLLVINNWWRSLRKRMGHDLTKSTWWGNSLSWLVTFIFVIAAWVLFRAESFGAAISMLESMAGLNGFVTPEAEAARFTGLQIYLAPKVFNPAGIKYLTAFLFIALFLPNTQQIMRNFEPGLGPDLDQPKWPWSLVTFKPGLLWGIIIAAMFAMSILSLARASEFLYFQF